MGPKKKLELPPALQTRAANRGRMVGAPDMPRPKRSHEDVLQEQKLKEDEAAAARVQQQVAIARVAELEQTLGEQTATTRPHTRQSARQGVVSASHNTAEGYGSNQGGSSMTKRLTLRLPCLPHRSIDGDVMPAQKSQTSAQGSYSIDRLSNHKVAHILEGAAGLEANAGTEGLSTADELLDEMDEEEPMGEIDSGDSADEYRPPGDSEGEPEIDAREDEEIELEEDVAAPPKGSTKRASTKAPLATRADVEAVKVAAAAQPARPSPGVGKRKPEDTGTSRTYVPIAPEC